jgi:hypothetical protein
MDEWDKFGKPCAGSRWFTGEPEITETPVQTYRQLWTCPACKEGEMVYAGWIWSTGSPGYHHTCDKCQFTAAIHTTYPRAIYR